MEDAAISTETKQRNAPLTVEEARERLLIYGLHLKSVHPDGRITTTTNVDVTCAADHIMTRMYGHLRRRGCPDCNSPFGERLLYALLRHYSVGSDDWCSKPIVGLDPLNPQRRLIFDAASESRQVAFENHSDYHDPGKGVSIFHQRIPALERHRLDSIKEARDNGGIHTQGPMKGWRVGTVWFDGPRINTFGQNYLPQVLKEFKTAAFSVGLLLRQDGIEIAPLELYRELGRTATAKVPSDLTLIGPWLGRTRQTQWRHTCGGEFGAVVLDLENISLDKTGCPFCDREGHAGMWLGFLDRLLERGYRYAGVNQLSIRTEFQTLTLKCERHPRAKVEEWTRSKLYQWLFSGPESGKSFPPPCAECAKTHRNVVAKKEKARRQDARIKVGEELRRYNHKMVTNYPSSKRDPITKKVLQVKNLIQCLGCGHYREEGVAQLLQKARQAGKINCPACSPGIKGRKPK